MHGEKIYIVFGIDGRFAQARERRAQTIAKQIMPLAAQGVVIGAPAAGQRQHGDNLRHQEIINGVNGKP